MVLESNVEPLFFHNSLSPLLDLLTLLSLSLSLSLPDPYVFNLLSLLSATRAFFSLLSYFVFSTRLGRGGRGEDG